MVYLKEITVATRNRTELLDVTAAVEKAVEESRIKDGICCLFVPHTTAGITINENADPDVVRDIKAQLDKAIPFEDNYSHAEGNSAAHIKSTLTGSAQIVFVSGGRLKFGTWQGIYFCEYDGPRSRKLLVKVIEG